MEKKESYSLQEVAELMQDAYCAGKHCGLGVAAGYASEVSMNAYDTLIRQRESLMPYWNKYWEFMSNNEEEEEIDDSDN